MEVIWLKGGFHFSFGAESYVMMRQELVRDVSGLLKLKAL